MSDTMITPGWESAPRRRRGSAVASRIDKQRAFPVTSRAILLRVFALLFSMSAAAVLLSTPVHSMGGAISAPSTKGLTLPEGVQYYAAPNGSPSGDGSWSNPWDLQTALSQPASVHPGDTIWLRGGTYTGTFTSTLTGTSAAPIVVRQYPGERAIIDKARVDLPGDILVVQGQYAWYWDFEITNSNPQRVAQNPGSDPADLHRGNGVFTTAPNTKFINLIVHDTAQGFGFWGTALNSTIYGCLIYNNGWQGPDRGHGHGIYSQNNVVTSPKTLEDNIVFDQYGYGIQLYGETNGQIEGYRMEGNSAANNGVPSTSSGYNYHVGGLTNPAEGVALVNNYGYVASSNSSRLGNMRVGYLAPYDLDVLVQGNYIWGGSYDLLGGLWEQMTVQDNTIVDGSYAVSDIQQRNVITSSVVWNNNVYYRSSGAFSWNSGSLDWAGWRNTTGFDASSSFAPAATGVRVFVQPNAYQPGRANITVFNHALVNSVVVDVSGVISVGQQYEVRNGHDFFAPPVVQGTYDGSPIVLPMQGLTIAQPIGYGGTVNPTAPQYNVFVLLGLSPPPVATPTPTRVTSTATPTSGPTWTAILPTATRTATPTPPAATSTQTASPTVTPVQAYTTTPLPTNSPSRTPTQVATSQPSNTPAPTNTPTPYPLTAQPSSTSTQVPVIQPSNTATPTNTRTSYTPTVQPTNTLTPRPTNCRPRFSDVPPGSTFDSYVACLVCKRVLAGYSDNTFRPNNSVTRGQIAKIVANAAGFNDDPGTQLFQDVQPNSAFYDFVQRLTRRGYMAGYACGATNEPCVPPGNLPYFRPGNNASRGQIAKIVASAGGFNDDPGYQLYSDVPPDSQFYAYIQRLNIHSVTGGYQCGGGGEPCLPPANRPYYRPNNTASRGQTSKMISTTFFPTCISPAQP